MKDEYLPELIAVDFDCRTSVFEHYTKLIHILSDKVKDGTISQSEASCILSLVKL